MSSVGVEEGRRLLEIDQEKSAMCRKKGKQLKWRGERVCRFVRPEHKEYEVVYVPITMYSDKTDVSNKKSAHPVMIGLANLPAHLVAKAQHRLFTPAGYFPIVSKNDLKKSKFPTALHSTCQRGVFHACLAVLFGASWQAARINGILVELNGRKLLLFPDILYASCDLPEAAMYTNTRGCRGKCPCAICELPLEKVISGELSVHKGAVTRVHMHEPTKPEEQEQLGRYDSENAFYKLVRNVHECIAAGDLHQVHLGVTDAVCKVWYLAVSKATQERFLSLTGEKVQPYHAWPNRNSSPFKSEGAKMKAYEVAGLFNAMVTAVVAIADENGESNNQVMIPVLEMMVAYTRFYKLVSVRLPTDEHLDKADEALATFMAVFVQVAESLKLDDSYPLKFHMLSHYTTLVRRFGPLSTQSTQRGEHEHSVSVKPASQRTNFSANKYQRDMLAWQSMRNTLSDHLRDVVARFEPTYTDKDGNEHERSSCATKPGLRPATSAT
ncbi:hypothetical protein BC828DRAFT_376688 [Blastocladiella britannica]|nr:hypothetical protein BC828DRAFT_376688 [Blastocladiella britannica]